MSIAANTVSKNIQAVEQSTFKIYPFFKRLFDVLFSLIIIICIFPIAIPIIAIIQKLTSKGSVFFIQERYGLHNTIFPLIKFRTYKNESCSHQLNLSKSEESITAFGKFLKVTNLDELPQFINVLLGQMSLIGPRPHAIAFQKYYEGLINDSKLFNARSAVRPGIIGLSQVLYLRGDEEDSQLNKMLILSRFTVDKVYAESLSLKTDIQVLWKLVFGASQNDQQMLDALEKQFGAKANSEV